MPLPDPNEVVAFAQEASRVLQGLDFSKKKAIISSVVERVVGTREKLQVYGFIPVTIGPYVNVCTDDSHRLNTPRHGTDDSNQKLIPFQFEVNITPSLVNHAQKGDSGLSNAESSVALN